MLLRLGLGQSVAGTKISTRQIDITTYPSDSGIAPGNRVTLALDITPPRGMHVYAPGAQAIASIRNDSSLVQERVLEATVEAMAALRGKDTLAITGTLQDQGCDDKVCYNPTSMLLL